MTAEIYPLEQLLDTVHAVEFIPEHVLILGTQKSLRKLMQAKYLGQLEVVKTMMKNREIVVVLNVGKMRGT